MKIGDFAVVEFSAKTLIPARWPTWKLTSENVDVLLQSGQLVSADCVRLTYLQLKNSLCEIVQVNPDYPDRCMYVYLHAYDSYSEIYAKWLKLLELK